jgi:23S rRNA pseudouridine955/2504/2580 synthase/23S rRNA pseudouridine1911/1915/1917 synthase
VPALVDALRTQLRQGKPELLRLGLAPEAEPQSVFSMDPQIAGVALLSFGDAATEDARNAYGSQLYTLRFQFVATGGPDLDSIECELPLAQHFSRPYTIVSHQTGKRTLTRFRRLERLGRWNLWEALTQYYRPDQLAVHATEVGLRIPGETKYAHEPLLRLSQLKRGWRGDKETEPALYEGLAAWLSDLTLNDGRTLSAQPPPRLANMIRQLRKHG